MVSKRAAKAVVSTGAEPNLITNPILMLATAQIQHADLSPHFALAEQLSAMSNGRKAFSIANPVVW
jgi:hypothetical protein